MNRSRYITHSALAVFILLTVAAAVSAGEVRETVLPNGLKVLTKEVHAAPVVSTYVWYQVGSRNEVAGITGITHWVEHMLFKGSKKFPKEQIKRVIEVNGGVWNGFTSYDYTAYYETLPSDKLELALELEADRMVNSLMDPEEFAAERSVIISEREGNENDPVTLLREVTRAAAYMAHPYGNPIIGWKSDLQSITYEQLVDYYRSYYAPNNATLVIVGDFETARALALVEKHFGGIPRGKPLPEVVTVEPPQTGLRRVKVVREGNTRYLMGGYHIPTVSHPDRYALDVLGIVMSSGRTSRLYRGLVDKELASAAYFWAGESKDPGQASFQIQVRDGVDPAEAEKAFLAQIERVKSEPVTDAELQRAIANAEADFVYSQDSVSRQASQLGYYETIDSYRFLDTYLDNLRRVTKDDVMRVARAYLNEDNLTIGEFVPISPGEGATAAPAPPPEPIQHYGTNDSTFEDTVQPPSVPGESKSGDALYVPGGGEVQAQGPDAPAAKAQATRAVLPNGLVVIVQENGSVPIVEMRAVVRAGGISDTDETAGLADFVANVMNKGTKKRTWQEISELTEAVGASVTMGGDTERSTLSARMLSKDFPTVLEVAADVLTNPAFPSEELEKYRTQLYTRLSAWEDSPREMAERKLFEEIYPKGHPYHRRLQGDRETISQFTQEDLVSFYRRHYRPDTTFIVISGDVRTEEAVAAVEKALGDWRAEGPPPVSVVPEVEPGKALSFVVTMPGKSQVEIRMGHPALKRTDPDYYAAYMMNTILGGSSGVGRLFADVRDKQGLAYGVWSYYDANLYGGTFLAGAGVNPVNVDKAIDAIKANVERMHQHGVTEQELSEAKSRNIGQFALAMETNAGIANVLSQVEFFGLGLDYPQRRAEILQAITKEQADEAARKYLSPESLSVVTAGPSLTGSEE